MNLMIEWRDVDRRKRGQILLIVALAMVGLLVAAGLAVDGGVLFMRKSQLDRAVDSAALAGVVVLSNSDLTAANIRGQQVLAANNIFTTSQTSCSSVSWKPAGPNDYCGERRPGLAPGAIRYHIEVLWESETYFMPLLGFGKFPLRSQATAEYLTVVDIFASDTSQFGLIKTASPSTYGPNICSVRGDAYIPVRGGPESSQTIPNPYYSELGGVYVYRIVVPPGYPYNKVRVEILDPDAGNRTWGNDIPIYERNGSIVRYEDVTDRLPAVARLTEEGAQASSSTGSSDNAGNPFWFFNLDEYVGSGDFSQGTTCSGSKTNNQRDNNNTLFRLFYYKQLSSGELEPVDLAYYIGKAWISTTDSVGGATSHPSTFGGAAGAPSGPYGSTYNAATASGRTATQYATYAYNEARATDLMWISPGVSNAAHRMPEFSQAAGRPIWPVYENDPDPPHDDIVRGTTPIVGLTSAAEPYTEVEPCNTIRAAFFRSQAAGGVDASRGFYTNAPSCSATSNGDFVIDLTTEVPDIYRPPGSNGYEFFLAVASMRGSGENVYDLWAGPSPDEDPDVIAPSYVNARHVYIVNELSLGNRYHNARGVGIYALGRRAMNMVTSDRVEIPLTYLGPEMAGLQMTISLYDSDSGSGAPFNLYFDTIPQSDWVACYPSTTSPPSSNECRNFPVNGASPARLYDASNNNEWQSYSFNIPSEGGTPAIPFYGGRLMASYDGGSQDTMTWKITLSSRPFLVQ